MKIIHISDLHLASPLTSRLPAARVRERKNELYQALERVIEQGANLGARAVIIAGDLFDSEAVSRRDIERVLGTVSRRGDMTFFYLTGNHEGNVLSSSGLTLPDNLRLFGEDWTYFELDGVTLAGRSTLTPDMAATLSLDPDRRNLVVLHGAVAEGCSENTVGLSELVGHGIDYLALGHYHSYSSARIDGRGDAVYCGTPEGRGFDEVGECGFVLVDTDTPRVSHRFIPSAYRTVRWPRVDIGGCERQAEIAERVREALKGFPSQDIVRVELVGARAPELLPDTAAISNEWYGRFYHLEVCDSSRASIDPEDYRYDKTLKGEFIRLVYSDPTLSDEEKDDIIRCGVAALLGEESAI